ncbi:hypothetical protein CYMTET_21993 [Cymbomonas tetramitiformis]|uniref:PiggyBac transposable element-derived protein domain-containing protein n=1 Tax=Cymbomonas tetramitiformis TaxID=36881 RepID=A0AAE0L2Q8_9CHLO|nr:hypothetical protein CYMTET_21993 [Cymbomonas tetramitiformis]
MHLATTEAELEPLSQKDLVEQCRLRALAKYGTKQALRDRIVTHMKSNPLFRISSTPEIAFDALGSRIARTPTDPPATQPPPPTTGQQPPAAAWVELSLKQAAQLRLRRPECVLEEEGYPSGELKDLTPTCHPLEWFNRFITEDFRTKIRDNTNAYAILKSAGGDIYPRFTAVKQEEIDCMLGLYLRHGLSPIPDMRLAWTNPMHSFVYGDERVLSLFPRGLDRFKELKGLLHVSNPLAPRKDTPFVKVWDLVDHVATNSRKNFVPPRFGSLDEIVIGFQGRCAEKDKIKYKDEGDGFIGDSICFGGYMYAFHFRHDSCPVVEKNASPLHNRCLYLAETLKEYDWVTLYFDNLFMSKNFLGWLYDRKKLGCGVCRTSGRGLPDCVIQKEVTKKAELEQAVGTIKVARSSDFRVLAMSIYDSKPVHLMSSAHTQVREVVKSRKIWDSAQGKSTDLEFKRLNVIDDYNFCMNGVDLCDQIRNQYRTDGPWMRQRKWWWSIFLWALEVGKGNAFLLYRRRCEQRQQKAMMHRVFIEMLARRLCGAEVVSPLHSRVSSIGEIGSPPSVKKSQKDGPFRAARITPASLEKMHARLRGGHPMALEVARTDCQWCKYKRGLCEVVEGKKRKEPGNPKTKLSEHPVSRATLGCEACHVWFCGPACWNEFHKL